MTTANITTYLWYFLIFGFLGWVAEVIYAACIQKRFVNRGFLNGPFCPIYGFGVVIIAFCLQGFRDNLILLFLGSTVLTTVLEFMTGLILERIFHTKWWDYSKSKFNLMGYVCLSFSLLWGLACTAIVDGVLPLISALLTYIPQRVSLIVISLCFALLLADFIITVCALAGLNKQIRMLNEISEKMREVSDKLGHLISAGTTDAQNMLAEADKKRKELKNRHAELTLQYQRTLAATGIIKRRVLKAFPDLRRKKYEDQKDELQLAVKRLKEFTDDMEEKRRKLVLETYEDRLPKNQERPFGYGLCFNKIFILFMIGNVVGCVLETIWCLLVDHKFEMRVGMVYGPFIPVYGIGAVLITLCLYKFYKVRDLWLFLGSMIIGASFEYFASYFQEMILGTVSWDYTGTLLNIDGRTNLMYGLIWGVLGLIWVKDLYPMISKLIQKIPKKIGNIVTIALVAFMIYNAFMSCAAVIRQNERREGKPPRTEFGVYLDETFPDEYLEFIYPHMQNVETGVENSGARHLENGDIVNPDGSVTPGESK